MKLGDLMLFYPASIIALMTKIIKTNISESSKQYIEENHLEESYDN